MRRRCPFRPTVQSLEDRTVLSFSLSSIWHSLLGVVGNNSSTPKPKSASTIAAEKVAAQTAAAVHAAKVAHQHEILLERQAARALAHATARLK